MKSSSAKLNSKIQLALYWVKILAVNFKTMKKHRNTQTNPQTPQIFCLSLKYMEGVCCFPPRSKDASEHTDHIQTCLALSTQLNSYTETQLQSGFSCEAISFCSAMKHGCFLQDLRTPNSTKSGDLMPPFRQKQTIC